MGRRPWFTALSTRPALVGNPPTLQGILQKHRVSFFLYALRASKLRQVAKFAPSLGPVPLPPTPPEPQPLDPPSRALVPPPSPHRLSFKKSFFFFLHFAPSLGPCPYHLPPRNQSPWTPPPEPLYPPPPHEMQGGRSTPLNV